MNEPLSTDEYGLGFTGYTREEAKAMLRGDSVPEPPPTDFSCVHRGAMIEIGKCDVCSMKGQPFEILACAVHGRCSIGGRNRKVRSCLRCEDRIPVASP